MKYVNSLALPEFSETYGGKKSKVQVYKAVELVEATDIGTIIMVLNSWVDGCFENIFPKYKENINCSEAYSLPW